MDFEAGRDMLWQKASFLTRLLSVAVRASERAGRDIKTICAGGELGIVDKGVNDLQTAADRTAQWTLVRSLRAKFGAELAIIGEEELEEDDDSRGSSSVETDVATDVLLQEARLPEGLRRARPDQVTVWIDPLDGTNEFAEAVQKRNVTQLEQVTVLVGIAVGTEPVAGLIHQPFFGSSAEPAQRSGRTLWALRSCGVHGAVPLPPDLGARLVVTTRSHGGGKVEAALDALRNAGLLHSVLRCGGAGYKVLRMLDGGAAAYIFASPGTKKWDTCGPQAILEELGGRLTDVHGSSLRYDAEAQVLNSAGVVATPGFGVEHGPYVDALPLSLKAALHPLARGNTL